MFRSAVNKSIDTAIQTIEKITDNMQFKNLREELFHSIVSAVHFIADYEERVREVVPIDEYCVKRINGRMVGGSKNILISNKKDLLSFIDFTYEREDNDDSWLYSMLSTDKETAIKHYNEIMSAKEIKYWR